MSNLPILITGSNRSGTTWLMTMLGLAPGAVRVFEPLSNRPTAYRFGGLAESWYPYAPAMPQERAREAFQAVLDGRVGNVFRRRQVQRWLPFTRRGRFVIKDSNACFSAEWLHEEFDLDVVVLVRHPAAYAASIKRMGWTFSFDNLLSQPRLMEEWLEPFREEMTRGPSDLVSQASLLWRCVYHALLTMADRNPSWRVYTHESLSRSPVEHLEELYRDLDLPWTRRVEKGVEQFTGSHNSGAPVEGATHSLRRDSAANVRRWKSLLTSEEVARIRRETESWASRFYDDRSWGDSAPAASRSDVA